MDRGAWWDTVHGVAENRTQLKTKHTALEEDVYLKRVFHTVLWIGEMESSILQ